MGKGVLGLKQHNLWGGLRVRVGSQLQPPKKDSGCAAALVWRPVGVKKKDGRNKKKREERWMVWVGKDSCRHKIGPYGNRKKSTGKDYQNGHSETVQN